MGLHCSLTGYLIVELLAAIHKLSAKKISIAGATVAGLAYVGANSVNAFKIGPGNGSR